MSPAILLAIILSAAVSAACASAVYIRSRTVIRGLRRESAHELHEMGVRLGTLEKELETCLRRLEEAEQRCVPVPDSFAIPSSIQLNRRGQVAQLYRRGETPRSIASALGMSQGEVKLIIKLHELKQMSTSAGLSGKSDSKNLANSR